MDWKIKDKLFADPWLWVIYGIVVLLNLIYFFQLRSTPYFNNLYLDPAYYWRRGQKIANGDWLGREIFEMSPLYPYLLGIYQGIFGQNLSLIRIIQILAASLTPVLTYQLGKNLLNQPAGVLAGIMTALYKPFFVYNSMLMKSWLSPLFYILTALLLSPPTLNGYSVFGAGLVWGLASLVRGNNLLILPLILIWLALTHRSKWYQHCAAFFLGFILVIAPVTIRNYVVGQEFVLVTSGGGEVFYIGSRPQNKGEYRFPAFVRPDPLTEHDDFRAEARRRTANPDLSRKEASSYWFSEGLKQIKTRPSLYLKNLGRKFVLFWNAYEIPDNVNLEFRQDVTTMLKWPLLTFGVIAPLGVLGIFWDSREEKRLKFSLLLLIGAFLSVAPFFVYARFRLGIVPLLAVGASCAVFNLYKTVMDKSHQKLTVYLLVLAVLIAFCNFPLDLNRAGKRAVSHANLGTLYYRQGDYGAALRELEEAVQIDPFNELAYRFRVLTYMDKGDYARALNSLEFLKKLGIKPYDYHNLKANIYSRQKDYRKLREEYLWLVKLEPNNFNANFSLGALYGEAGDFETAIKYLEIAKRINPNNSRTYHNLALAYEKLGNQEKAKHYNQQANKLQP